MMLLGVVNVHHVRAEEPSPSKMEMVRAIAAEATPAASSAPRYGESDLAGSAWKMTYGLAITLGALFVGLGLARRFGIAPKAGDARRLRLVDRIAISRKTMLVLAEVDGRSVLLAVGGEPVSFHEEFSHLEAAKAFDTSLEDAAKEES